MEECTRIPRIFQRDHLHCNDVIFEMEMVVNQEMCKFANCVELCYKLFAKGM